MKSIGFLARACCLAGLYVMSACSQSSHPTSQTKEAWDANNDPSLFSLSIMKLEDLPTEGRIADAKVPWPDSYWPTYAGGISHRWLESPGGTDYRDYLYEPLDAEQLLRNASRSEIARLSPAEKFDLYLGRYDFPLTQFEQRRTLASVDPRRDEVPTWFGLCHGWAVASLLEREPGEMALARNPDGLEIPFFTSDIGALLTHIYAFSARSGRSMGARCNTREHDIERDENGRVILRECRDLNPGSFHLALTQMLGLPDREDREPFTIDTIRSDEVWNYPIIGYEVESLDIDDYVADEDELAEYRAEGTDKLARVEVSVSYVGGTSPHMRPLSDRFERYVRTDTYSYTLELDEDGRIIGGEWESERRPDFMWMISEKPAGTVLVPYAEVARLLAMSRGENGEEMAVRATPN